MVKSLSLILFAILLCSNTVFGDAIVRSQAMKASTIIEFYVEESGIRAELEIGIRAIPDFKNILPDAIYQHYQFPENPADKRLELFFSRQLPLLDADGKALPGKVITIGPSKRTIRDPISGEPLAVQTNASDVIKATLHYSFKDNTPPEHILFSSPQIRNIGFVVYHHGVAVNDFRYLRGRNTLSLDWDDPWYSQFQTRSLRRQYYAPMSGFIYVDPFEVRKEIIARPKDIQRWVDLGLENKKTIPIDIQGNIKEKIAEFFLKHHPVSIDGKAVNGLLHSVNFLERTLTRSRVIEPPEELNIDAALVGVIFVYPRNGLPKEVEMEWDLWDERIREVPASSVDQEGPFASVLEPNWNKLKWINFLKKPIVPTLHNVESPVSQWRIFLNKSLIIFVIMLIFSLIWLMSNAKHKKSLIMPTLVSIFLLSASASAAILGESNEPTHDRAKSIVNDLLHNIYRAFDYREESQVYDVLARSVSGELLTDIFLETKRSLVLSNQGGARAKVRDIALETLEIKPNDKDNRFIAEASWVVNGSVGHWGHVHQRKNSYQALLTISVVEGQWKLEKMQVLQEERL